MLTQHHELDITMETKGRATLLMHTNIRAAQRNHTVRTYIHTNTYVRPTREGSRQPNRHYLKVCQLLVQSGMYLEMADLTDGGM